MWRDLSPLNCKKKEPSAGFGYKAICCALGV